MPESEPEASPATEPPVEVGQSWVGQSRVGQSWGEQSSGERRPVAGAPRGASIMHADLDAFYASVEQRDHPHLRGRPVAVGGGVVLAASYEARAHGVRGAMGLTEARRRCPGLRVVPPRMSAYAEASRAVFAIFERTTPWVEGISIDEAFLDVSGLGRIAGPAVDIGARLRREVGEEVGLPISVGIASTKFLAKVASGVGKPDGLLEVPPGGELAFLHPLPVQRLWGVGPKTAERLRGRGLVTVADVARLPEEALVAIVGRGAGSHLHALAHNRDPRRVQSRQQRRSIGAQRAIGRRGRSPAELDAVLIELVDRVARRLRSAGRVGRTVVLRLRFDDYERISRSATLAEPTDETRLILAALRRLLGGVRGLTAARGVTLVGIALTNLGDDGSVQLELPWDRRDSAALDRTVDAVRERFGAGSLTRAVLLGRPRGVSAPQLPD